MTRFGSFHLNLSIVLLLISSAVAREWRSADGKSTVDAKLVATKDGKVLLERTTGGNVLLPLSSLSKDDQEFAEAGGKIAADALARGPSAFLVEHRTEGGWLCKMGKEMQMQKGKYLFTGERFFLASSDTPLSAGSQQINTTLYAEPDRTFVPLEGELEPIKSFNLSLEEASNSTLQSKLRAPDQLAPAVYEPLIEAVTTLGLGLVITDKGHLLVEASLLDGAKDITVDAGKDHAKGAVVATHPKLPLAVIKCDAPLPSGRFGGKKPLALGQNLFGVSIPANPTRKGLGQPAVSKGIVSRLIEAGNSKGMFEHDIALPEDVLGGLMLTDKGEVAGVFFSPLQKKSKGSTGSSSASQDKPTPRAAYSTLLLNEWLSTVPGVSGLKNAGAGPLEEVVSELKAGVTLVTSLQDVIRERPKVNLTKSATPSSSSPATAVPGGSGWSLSKSGTRHNSKCKFYDPGKACQGTDGKACKICGG